MTALQPRAWGMGDRVARLVRRGGKWELGTVAAVEDYLLIRWDDDTVISVRHLDDPHVLHEDEVPALEQWWVSEKTREQLVRQEAATRLRSFARALLPLDGVAWARAVEIADDLDHVLLVHDGLAAAARALLAPAREPAPTA